MHDRIVVEVGGRPFPARLEWQRAPLTCAALASRLPIHATLVHARWSGEACWVPLGTLDLGVPLENATSQPAPGAVLFHPADHSECEILVPYGPCRFASKHGPLSGTHFLTIDDVNALAEVGERILRSGQLPVTFRAA